MIKIENLTKSFRLRKVLENLSLDLGIGVYGLLGPNGSGKTTLLRCLTGIYPEGAKSITFARAADADGHQQQMSYLPQTFGAIDNLTAFEMLCLICHLKKLPKKVIAEEAMEALQAVNLEDRAHDQVRKLSGGMVRRLGIAQALMGNPLIRLFDEPTAGLDPEERLRFKRLMQSPSNKGLTIISTHIVEDIEATCDHVIVLLEGKIAFQGTQEELSGLASDLVFNIPQREYVETEDSFIIKEFDVDNIRHVRVLTKEKDSYRKYGVSPNIEDGYISLLKGFTSAG